MLVRNRRLDIPAIWRDGDKPVLPIILDEIHILEKWSWILGAKADNVHCIGAEFVTTYLYGIEWVSNTDNPLF